MADLYDVVERENDFEVICKRSGAPFWAVVASCSNAEAAKRILRCLLADEEARRG